MSWIKHRPRGAFFFSNLRKIRAVFVSNRSSLCTWHGWKIWKIFNAGRRNTIFEIAGRPSPTNCRGGVENVEDFREVCASVIYRRAEAEIIFSWHKNCCDPSPSHCLISPSRFISENKVAVTRASFPVCAEVQVDPWPSYTWFQKVSFSSASGSGDNAVPFL